MECNFETTSKTDMDNHVKDKHSYTETEEVNFECLRCNHVFNRVENYNSHVKAHETEDVLAAEVKNNNDTLLPY